MRTLFLAFTLFLAVPAAAQLTFETLPGPNGTFTINCIAVDPSTDAIYVGTPNGTGAYRSTDDGATWESISAGLPVNGSVKAIAISGSTLFAISDSIYKSTDAGDSWEALANGPVGMTNLHVTSGGTIYAGAEVGLGGQGVFRSTDGGDSWTQAVNGLPSYVVYLTYYRSVSGVTSDSSGNIYCAVNGGSASTEAGVYVSTDGGDNWTRSVTGLRQNSTVKPIGRGPNDLLYVGVREQLYASSDQGATWTRTDSLQIPTSATLQGLAFNASGEVFLATTAGLFRGAKGGTGWTNIASSPLPNNTNSVAVAPGTGTLIAGSFDLWGVDGGCYRSTDDGSSWEHANEGMNNAFLLGLTVTPDGSIFTGLGRGRVDYSTDGGTTFTRASLPYTSIYQLAGVSALRGNGNNAVVAGTGEGLYTSTDGGANWTKTSTAAGRWFITDASENFYAATSSGVLKSTDNGLTWEGTGGGGNSYSVFLTAAGTLLSGSYNSGVDRTTDGGTTWTNSGTSLFGAVTIGKFVQLPNGTVYVHSLLGMYRSTDDGASWSAVTTSPVGQQYRTLASSGGTLLLGTPAGLYQSIDGAETWSLYADGLRWTILDHVAVGPDNHVYASGGYGIYRTAETITTAVEEIPGPVPTEFALSQNYPNPFNPSTKMEFTIPVGGFVTARVFDALGREVARLVDGTLAPGRYTAAWDASGAAGGVYFCEVRASTRSGSFSALRKMVLVK